MITHCIGDDESPAVYLYVDIINRIRVTAADTIGDAKPRLAEYKPPR